MTGIKEPDKPDLLYLHNHNEGIELLHKHLYSENLILIHGDVDMDGIGSVYILNSFIKNTVGLKNVLLTINKEKIHGINKNHVEFTHNKKVGLFVILDSSTNEIELIKNLNCDVLVIDHHEVSIPFRETIGNTCGGKYVIINNMIDYGLSGNKNESLSNMSCGLTLYEFLRLYEDRAEIKPVIENLKLYQWAGITLISDMIKLNNSRNQWYIKNTVESIDHELVADQLIKAIDKWNFKVDKNFIAFKIGPLINSTMRANKCNEALSTIINEPQNIFKLKKYKEIQNNILLNENIGEVLEFSNFLMLNLTNEVGSGYAGLIATKICRDKIKNCVVYKINNNIAQGSFRGISQGGLEDNINLRLEFLDKARQLGIEAYAEGHAKAFGFRVNIKYLKKIMESISGVEDSGNKKYYITAGDMSEERKGKYHINNLDTFRKNGLLWKLGVANSRLSEEEVIKIILPTISLNYVESKDKIMKYTIDNLECISFEPIITKECELYVEYSNNLKIYVKNLWNSI